MATAVPKGKSFLCLTTLNDRVRLGHGSKNADPVPSLSECMKLIDREKARIFTTYFKNYAKITSDLPRYKYILFKVMDICWLLLRKIKVRVRFLYSATYTVGLEPEQHALQSWKWQLIGKSQWCCSARQPIHCPR